MSRFVPSVGSVRRFTCTECGQVSMERWVARHGSGEPVCDVEVTTRGEVDGRTCNGTPDPSPCPAHPAGMLRGHHITASEILA